MRKRLDIIRFALKCILIPAVAVFLLYCLNKPYLKIDEQKYADVIKFDMLGREYWEIRVGNLGSSHGAYDFNYDSIREQEGCLCFNFANTSQTYDYDYAILQAYGQYMEPDSILFIPVSYFSFNNEVVNAAEREAMSIRYYHFLPPEYIPDYDLYTDVVTHKMPILSAGENIIDLFPKLKLALTAHAADDGIDEEEFARRAVERYSRHFDNKEEYFLPERIDELYAIINYCKDHEITPVLITTPFSKYYRDLVSDEFLQEFNTTVTKIATDTGVNYYDYSYDPRFRGNLDYFSDSDHLNDEGAHYFMEILEEETEELRELLD